MAFSKDFYIHLHALEKRYGSIAKAPESDDDMKAIRKYNPINNDRTELLNSIMPQVRKLADKGYSLEEIMAKTMLSQNLVLDTLHYFKIDLHPKFLYKLTDSKNKIYYIFSLRKFVHIFSKDYDRAANRERINYLILNGYTIRKGKYPIKDVKVGNYFMKPNGSRLFRKYDRTN